MHPCCSRHLPAAAFSPSNFRTSVRHVISLGLTKTAKKTKPKCQKTVPISYSSFVRFVDCTVPYRVGPCPVEKAARTYLASMKHSDYAETA
jgi:hypothetical protein